MASRRRPGRSGGQAPEPSRHLEWPALGDLVGHSEAVARLRGSMMTGHLGHALLITGPDRLGKTALALALAGELLPRSSWPADLVTHPDLWLEDSAEEAIRIDRVRAGREPGSLQEFLSLRPYAGGRRLAVLARTERLTEQAANSLLKTIEEPPPGSHLLLTARAPEALPATILSRCQRITLVPVAANLIDSWLRDRHGIPGPIASEAAELSGGRPGRALHLAREPEALAAELAVLDRFLAIRGAGGAAAALTAAAELAPPAGPEGRERLLLNLSIWASFVRDAAAAGAGAPELVRRHSRPEALERWTRSISPARAGTILDALLRASTAVAANAHPRLLLEVLLLEIFAGEGAIRPPALDGEAADP